MELKVNQIPPLQGVVLKVVRYELNKEISNSKELVDIISNDKGLCSKILQIANSAYFAASDKVENLNEAVNRLGLKTIKMIVMTVMNSNLKSILKKGIFKKYIHEYPLVTAYTAVELCKIRKLDYINLDDLFIEGLFHKIGMTIIALNAPKHYAKLLEAVDKENLDLLQKEDSLFKTNHIAVGIKLAKDWNFHQNTQEVIEIRIDKLDQLVYYSEFVRLINLAEIIARELTGCAVREADIALKDKLVQFYNFKSDDLALFNENYMAALREKTFFRLEG